MREKKSGKKFSAIIATQANLSAILNIYWASLLGDDLEEKAAFLDSFILHETF